MKYVVTAEQMRAHERYIMDEIGIDAVILMERAALFAAGVIKDRAEKEKSILIVCGAGNNGADGIAVARILTECGYKPEVLLLGREEKYTDLRQKQENIFRKMLGEQAENRIHTSLTDTKATRREYSVIVDAVLGIGTSRELSGELKEAVDWMNDRGAIKIALDIPTGICADTGRVLGTAFRADITATFGLHKQGILLGEGKVFAGEICYNSCGMLYPFMDEKQTFVLDKKTVKKYLKRNPAGNKSTFGKLAFFSGSETITGAAILNVCAAFRSGAGYIKLCTHEKNKEAVLKAAPESVLELYDTDTRELLYEKVKQSVEFADVICAGSGLGRNITSKAIVENLTEIIAKSQRKTYILDADVLNLMSEDAELLMKLSEIGRPFILTPHVLEFSRISGLSVEQIKEDRVKSARDFAKKYQCILVLKDAQTVVAGADGRVCISAKGNNGMAVAGSGDVLAGAIAGIAGQIKDPYMAACIGVYVHGMAGDMAAKKYGTHSMLPTDMIHCLEKCMKKLGKEAI
ncbi:MAG: NAD(P)H-hydrate dehydratase [Lachnospiraceae bacterium]|nr:NAD(P)H-hydrate dehydratase [Lachnospiraceae bacterium]